MEVDQSFGGGGDENLDLSQTVPETQNVSPGRIVRIEVENFKSYNGLAHVGPFKSFTAIIGPNGAGKSNLMDAICFVLGVRTDKLRGQLRDLLHCRVDSNGKEIRAKSGYVKMVFLDKDEHEVHFSRVFVSGQGGACHSQYKINEVVVSAEEYSEKLKGYGILARARNFLVFQGDIGSVAQMTPKELGKMLEQISGSAGMAAEYDELKAALESGEENVKRIARRKGAVAAEKKQKKEAKDQAEKYQRLQDDLRNTQLTQYHWQLFHINQDMDGLKDEIDQSDASFREASKSHTKAEKKSAEKQKEHGKVMKECLGFDKNLQKLRNQKKQFDLSLLRIDEEIKWLKKKKKVAEKQVEEKKEKAKEQEGITRKVEADLDNVRDALKTLEEKMAHESSQGLKLSEEDLAEYSQIKLNVEKKLGALFQQRRNLEWEKEDRENQLARKKETIEQLKKQGENCQRQKEQMERRRDELTLELSGLKNDKVELRRQRGELTESNRRQRTQRDHLTRQIDTIEKKLSEAKAHRSQNKREKLIEETVNTLKSKFPGVYGQISELAKVRQKSYNLALAVALQRDMSSVLVDSDETVKNCIKYLKENRLISLVFLPLSSISAGALNENLRELGGSAKLAIDLLDFDRRFWNGFLYACGNAVVCDSMEEAAQLKANRQWGKLKVISKDGTIFHKSGIIAGGRTRNREARAATWESHEIKVLNQEREKCEKNIQKITSIRDGEQEEQKLTCEINKIEEKIRRIELEIEGAKLSMRDNAINLENAEKAAAKNLREIPEMEESLKNAQKEMDKVKERSDQIADRMFEDFSRRVGVESYREYEERHIKCAQEYSKRKKELRDQIDRLENQLKYSPQMDIQNAIEKLNGQINECKNGIDELKANQGIVLEDQLKVESDLAEDTKRCEDLTAEGDALTQQINQLKEKMRKCQNEANRAKAKSTTKKRVLEETKMHYNEVIQTATTEFGGDFQVDFSTLDDSLISTESEEERENMKKEFSIQISKLENELSKMAFNKKAFEQYDQIKEAEAELKLELEAARKLAQSDQERFDEVHATRSELFMRAFNHVSSVINNIYSDLTTSDLHPEGSAAYLHLRSITEPFSHGIVFTVKPPAKSHQDIQELSGGERTMAALALLFAIHSFKPCPFFILDEVDASLDGGNVEKVANYLRVRSRQESAGGVQIIVISLKDCFFAMADCLVGVAKKPVRGTSETFRVDLSGFPLLE